MNAMQSNILRWLAAAARGRASSPAARGGGAPTAVNPDHDAAPPVADYTGPAPANADVQAFRINLWENIKANNRCGGCHNAGGQTPKFARNDDVNLAYQAANTRRQSHAARSVAHGAEGRPAATTAGSQSRSACADTSPSGSATGPAPAPRGGTQIQLAGSGHQGSGRQQELPGRLGAASQLDRLYTLVRDAGTANCVRCHSLELRPTPQRRSSPSARRPDEAYAAAQVEDQSRQSGQLALRRAPARRVPQLLAARAARPTPDAMLAAINAFAERHHRHAGRSEPADLARRSRCTTARSPPAATATKRTRSPSTSSRPARATSPIDTSGRRTGAEPDACRATSPGSAAGASTSRRAARRRAPPPASKKLTDLIKSTGEFTIEAWASTGQRRAGRRVHRQLLRRRDGAQRHARAAACTSTRRCTRSDKTGANGSPALLTRDADRTRRRRCSTSS